MGSEHDGSRRNFDSKQQRESERACTPGEIIRLVLPDQALAALGFMRGDTVEVLLGDIWQGDLAALLLRSGDWIVGFAFFAYAGVRLHQARTDMPPKYLPLDAVVTGGRVVRVGGSALLQSGITLPSDGVDRIRFRFRP
jgi:hypothetical protein